MYSLNQEKALRFTAAAEHLFRRDAEPDFAQDAQSVVFLNGMPLDGRGYAIMCDVAKRSGMDLVHFSFEPGRERFGPTNVAVFQERGGLVYTWSRCDLWSPANDGPLLVMPHGVEKVCFAYDGLALESMVRPVRATGEGVARARTRLRFAERDITKEQLSRVRYEDVRSAA